MIFTEEQIALQEHAQVRPLEAAFLDIAVSYGGGTNSVALLILLRDLGLIPKFITMADTGFERRHTYAHLPVMQAWLRKNGFPPITMVRRVNGIGEVISIQQKCMEKKMLPSIAYGHKSCSEKFKVQPQEKFLNNHPAAKEIWNGEMRILKLIGYDADEERRVRYYPDDKKYLYEYPLVQWAGWDRDDCVAAIEREGLPLPGKSSCAFCPSMTYEEIDALKETDPDLLEQALAVEDNAMDNLDTVKGLGRRFNWRIYVETGDRKKAHQGGEVLPAAEIPCGCYSL